ncbi:MAG: hypothetical protein NTAFB09_14690 [Nitrosospira sp.]
MKKWFLTEQIVVVLKQANWECHEQSDPSGRDLGTDVLPVGRSKYAEIRCELKQLQFRSKLPK